MLYPNYNQQTSEKKQQNRRYKMYRTLTRNRTHNWHGFDSLFKEFERHFAPLRAQTTGHSVQSTDDNHATITLALPGVDPKDIEVQVNDNVVTISAEAHLADAEGKLLLDEFIILEHEIL